MRIITVLIYVAVSMNAFASEDLNSVERVATCSVGPHGKRKCEATQTLRKLLTALNVKVGSTFDAIVDEAQKLWLRPKGTERWQMTERFEGKRGELMPLFREFGLVEATHASKKKYDYAAIHGATLLRVESRINWLVGEWNKGVRFEHIVFLSGERILDDKLELPEVDRRWRCCEWLPSNETQMIKWLWNKMVLPDDMRKLPVTFVNAQASEKRAHTGDTVVDWVKQDPRPGSILAISNQPFVSYQDMTMRNRLPAHFSLETIGEAASENVMNVVYLDNVARLLFELKKWESQ